MPSSDHRRFSFAGRLSELVNVAAWKFDVLLRDETPVTSYVKRSDRGDAFKALFAACPGAKVFGTGLPLTEHAAKLELSRSLQAGEVHNVADMGGPGG